MFKKGNIMKLFEVYVSDWEYDDYKAAIVAAESEEQIRNSIVEDTGTRILFLGGCGCCFDYRQGDIHIKEIELDKIISPKILFVYS